MNRYTYTLYTVPTILCDLFTERGNTMFCTNCGNNIPDGSAACPVCGAPVQVQQPQQPQQPAYQQPAYQQPAYQQPPYQQPMYQQPAADDGSGSVLTFGILGLALSWIPVLGLIFSIIGLKKSGAFAAAHGGTCFGKAKAGRILSIIGLVSSIIGNIYWLIVIIGVATCASTPSYYYYSYY